MTHTPGPWKAACSPDVWAWDPDIGRPARTYGWWIEGPRFIDCPDDDGGTYFREDDARLIAAAPDLLAALEALFDRCEEVRLDYTDPAGVGSAMGPAQRAITKAKGETP